MAFTAVMLPATSDSGCTDLRQLTLHSFPESAGGPEEDASDMESGQVDGRGLRVARGDAAPLLQTVDAPFDGVDRVDHLTMVPPAATPLRSPVRELGRDPRPLRVGQRYTRTNDQLIQTKPSRRWVRRR